MVARAIERASAEIPVMPGEEDPLYTDARRADAFVALCSARIAGDKDPDRATVVVHAQLDGLSSGDGGCEIENGPVIHPETAKRLLCNSGLKAVVEDGTGDARLGRVSREPSASVMRQLRYRDRECRFPGCGARRFTQAHHIVWWENGGRTDLDNLVLVCFFQPQAGARVRVEACTRDRRDRPLVPTRRNPLHRRTGAAASVGRTTTVGASRRGA